MVVVGLIVTETGLPQGTHIVKSGGESFDTAALKAVSQYRFDPATLRGKPVPVEINIEVQFQLY